VLGSRSMDCTVRRPSDREIASQIRSQKKSRMMKHITRLSKCLWF